MPDTKLNIVADTRFARQHQIMTGRKPGSSELTPAQKGRIRAHKARIKELLAIESDLARKLISSANEIVEARPDKIWAGVCWIHFGKIQSQLDSAMNERMERESKIAKIEDPTLDDSFSVHVRSHESELEAESHEAGLKPGRLGYVEKMSLSDIPARQRDVGRVILYRDVVDSPRRQLKHAQEELAWAHGREAIAKAQAKVDRAWAKVEAIPEHILDGEYRPLTSKESKQRNMQQARKYRAAPVKKTEPIVGKLHRHRRIKRTFRACLGCGDLMSQEDIQAKHERCPKCR